MVSPVRRQRFGAAGPPPAGDRLRFTFGGVSADLAGVDGGSEIGGREYPQRVQRLPRSRESRKDFGWTVHISAVDGDEPPGGVESERQLVYNPGIEPFRRGLAGFGERLADLEREPVRCFVDAGLVTVEDREVATVAAMSEAGHAVEGYIVCRCGSWVPEALAHQTRGMCTECFGRESSHLKVVEAVHRGSRMALPVRSGRKAKKKGSKGKQATHQAARKAEMSALRRLRALYPELYDMLYDEERVARGLPPKYRPDADHAAAVKTYQVPPAYAALIEGTTTDAIETRES